MTSSNGMRFRWPGVCLAMAIGLLLPPALSTMAMAQGRVASFSADWVMIGPDGKVLSTSKLYVTPDAYRLDGLPLGAGRPGQAGVDQDFTALGQYPLKREYLYNHARKLVYQTVLDERTMMGMSELFRNPDTEVVLGRESVSGYPCVKKRVTGKTDALGMELTITQTIWQSDRFEMPLRTETEEGYVSELRNIDPSPPAERLFRPLIGYTPVDNMLAVLGMDMSDGVTRADGAESRGRGAARREGPGERPRVGRPDPAEDGADGGQWHGIPRRPGDRIGSEMQLPHGHAAILGTRSSLAEVCRFYETELGRDGWRNSGGHIQDNVGFLILAKGDRQLRVSSADDPGMDGIYPTFYSLQLVTGGAAGSSARAGEPRVPGADRSPRGPAGRRVAGGLLFPNSDFEQGDLSNWTATGEAFRYQPVKGDNPTARRRGQPSQHQGEYWVGTYEKYQGVPGQQPGQTQGDRPTGVLTSIPFEILGDSIRFLIGGGNHINSVYVALVVDGREVRKATGENRETLRPVSWDVAAFRGLEARIVIVDRFERGWGHINADDFRYGPGN